jgi:hypothetical protein
MKADWKDEKLSRFFVDLRPSAFIGGSDSHSIRRIGLPVELMLVDRATKTHQDTAG